jgi:hypothetical protein
MTLAMSELGTTPEIVGLRSRGEFAAPENKVSDPYWPRPVLADLSGPMPRTKNLRRQKNNWNQTGGDGVSFRL